MRKVDWGGWLFLVLYSFILLMLLSGCVEPRTVTEQEPSAAPVQEAEGVLNVPIQSAQTTADDSKQVQHTVGLANQFRFEILSGSGGIVLVVALVLITGRARRSELIAKVLALSVERAAGDHGVRGEVPKMSDKYGLNEKTLQRFREKVGATEGGRCR